MSPALPVVFISTYPPEHCGVGKSAYDLVQEVRRSRTIWVVGNEVPGAPRESEGVRRAWRKRRLGFSWAAAAAAGRLAPDGRAIAQVNHHFFLYGSALSNLEFPLLLVLLRLKGFRIAVEIHSVIDPTKFSIGPGESTPLARIPMARFAVRWFYRVVSHLSDIVFVPGESMRRSLIEQYGLAASHVRSVSPGWDIYPRSPGPGVEEDPGTEYRIVFHGFLDPSKGLEVLIDAFSRVAARLPRARLVIAGEVAPELREAGPRYAEALRQRARASGFAERVTFTGYLDEEGLSRTLAGAHLFVLPYTMVLSRGGSAVLTRVATLGRPLIASRISRFSDELVEGEDALLVPPGDTEALAEAIGRVATDPALGRRLGERLRERSEGRGWDATARTMEREVYAPLDATAVPA